MRLVDQIRFAPFSTSYHRALVDGEFATALQRFLERELLPQVDVPTCDAEGTLTATFDRDKYCGPSSLVRDIFTLEIVLSSDTGTSELKADIVFDPDDRSFSPRTGHDHFFYLWTPARKQRREREMEVIQRFVDDIQRGRQSSLECPICGGRSSAINDSATFDVRCTDERCFQYNYHKDEDGRLAHGHFFTKHPAKRAEQRRCTRAGDDA